MVDASRENSMKRLSYLDLPQDSPATQIRRRAEWNASRPCDAADFFTIGYAGRTIQNLVDALKARDVQSVIDIRYSAFSAFRPEFSKRALQETLAEYDIAYFHSPQLGVPRDIRGIAAERQSREHIWSWYDEHVVGKYVRGNLHRFFNSVSHPLAFLCVELDPTACHRHRLTLALERLGLRSCDI